MLDEDLCIAFVEEVLFVELDDIVVKDQDAGSLATLHGGLNSLGAVSDSLGLREAK